MRRRLPVVRLVVEDSRALACSAQLRYLQEPVYESTPQAGDRLVFTQIYYAHDRFPPTISSNHAEAKATDADELQATAGASGIQVIRDDTEATLLRLEMTPGKVEWVLLNPGERMLEVAVQQSQKPYGYV